MICGPPKQWKIHTAHEFESALYRLGFSLTIATDAAYVIGMILLNEKAQEMKEIQKKKSKSL